MITEPVIHPKTYTTLENAIKKKSHALIIAGPDGAGKAYLAIYLTQKLLNEENLEKYPYFLHIKPEKQSISIETIREVQASALLKTTGKNDIRRVILIEDAHCMGREAQNAFLKLLEEPPQDTCIIMTTDSKDKLLPTVRSRATIIKLTPPIKQQILNYYTKKGFKKEDIEKNYFISSGRIGLLDALLSGDEEHPLVRSIDETKSVLGMTTFDRLVYASNIDTKTFNTPEFLDGLIALSKAAMEQAISKEDETSTKRWLHINKLANKFAHDYDKSTPNTNIVMTDLMLNL